MLPEQIGYITILLGIVGAFPYIKNTLSGKTKPNKIGWFVWALAPIIGAFLQFKSGATFSAIPILMEGILSLSIFFFSFVNKNAYWKITILDITCGILSGFALILWILTRESNISTFFIILADLLAGFPILIKSWKYPETETGSAYYYALISNVVGLLTIKNWVFSIYSIGVYFVLMNFLITLGIYHKKIFKK